MEGKSPKEAIQEAIEKLTGYTSTPRLDAEILFAKVLKIPQERVFFYDKMLSDNQIKEFNGYISNRQAGQPVAYIMGVKEFWGMEFKVNESVLIPRPDTETLIEVVNNLYNSDQKFRFLDLGTGSGCIGITIAKIFPNCAGVLVDKSVDALNIAQENALNIGVQDQLKFVESDWFDSLEDQKFDLIVSNPPYIDPDWPDVESIKYEPKTALFAEENGLESYKNIAVEVRNYIASNGKIVLEIGFDQANSVREVFSGFSNVNKYKDLNGNDRVLVIM